MLWAQEKFIAELDLDILRHPCSASSSSLLVTGNANICIYFSLTSLSDTTQVLSFLPLEGYPKTATSDTSNPVLRHSLPIAVT